MQTDNKLFEDMSKVATAAFGTLAGIGRELEDAAKRRAREFTGADAISPDEFDAVRTMAANAREAAEALKAEVASLRAEIAALKAAAGTAAEPVAAPDLAKPDAPEGSA